LSKDETLEVTTALIFLVKTTIRPRFDDNLVVIGNVEFGNCLLEFGVGLADIDKNVEFFAVGKGVLASICVHCGMHKLTVSKPLGVPCQ
jgi:hypothetical protein